MKLQVVSAVLFSRWRELREAASLMPVWTSWSATTACVTRPSNKYALQTSTFVVPYPGLLASVLPVSYTHLTLSTNREV